MELRGGGALLTGTAGDDDKTFIVVAVAADRLLGATGEELDWYHAEIKNRERRLTNCCC